MKIALKYEELDDTLFIFLGNLVRYVVLIFAALFVLNTFGVQTTSFIAALGAAGLAIGLALQGTLSNVAAGVMIILFPARAAWRFRHCCGGFRHGEGHFAQHHRTGNAGQRAGDRAERECLGQRDHQLFRL